jgi:hypothetical protein
MLFIGRAKTELYNTLISRLYRRTNRELPAKPCTYMTSLLEPINHFSQGFIKQSS